MNTNALMTVGAIGFALFALSKVAAKPTPAIATQVGQQQRDSDLTAWNQGLLSQWEHVSTQAQAETHPETDAIFAANQALLSRWEHQYTEGNP